MTFPERDDLRRELESVQEKIRNANSIGSTLLGASITAAGIAVPLMADRIRGAVAHQPLPVLAVVGACALALLGTLWALLDAVLPRLDGARRSFLSYVGCRPEEVRRRLAAADLAAEIETVARIAEAKYTSLHRARLLGKAALVLAVPAAVLVLAL